MKKYRNKTICGDCLEVMKTMEDIKRKVTKKAFRY